MKRLIHIAAGITLTAASVPALLVGALTMQPGHRCLALAELSGAAFLILGGIAFLSGQLQTKR